MIKINNHISAVPFESLKKTSEHILKLLMYRYDFTTWLTVYYKQGKWIILSVIDDNYGFKKGHVFKNDGSFFDVLAKGAGPNYAENIDDVEAYKNTGLNKKYRISTFFGIPILGQNSKIFGVICAFDPEVKQLFITEDIEYLKINARMLSTLFEKEYYLKRKDITLGNLENTLKYDLLTGIYNRSGFIERSLSEEVIRSDRYDQNMGIIILDLENILGTNPDHEKNNNLLKETANILTDTVRAYDICARINEFEFSVLLLDISEKTLEIHASKMQAKLQQLGINATLGWALKSPRVEFATAVATANKMMLKNKQIERNNYIIS